MSRELIKIIFTCLANKLNSCINDVIEITIFTIEKYPLFNNALTHANRF